MKACGGAVFPAVVNMAAGMRDQRDAKGKSSEELERAADASQSACAASGQALGRENRQRTGRDAN